MSCKSEDVDLSLRLGRRDRVVCGSFENDVACAE